MTSLVAFAVVFKINLKNVEDLLRAWGLVSSLNIKSDILSSQIEYTTSGLNKIGNTVTSLEDNIYILI